MFVFIVFGCWLVIVLGLIAVVVVCAFTCGDSWLLLFVSWLVVCWFWIVLFFVGGFELLVVYCWLWFLFSLFCSF